MSRHDLPDLLLASGAMTGPYRRTRPWLMSPVRRVINHLAALVRRCFTTESNK